MLAVFVKNFKYPKPKQKKSFKGASTKDEAVEQGI